jgi:hypothetical protein
LRDHFDVHRQKRSALNALCLAAAVSGLAATVLAGQIPAINPQIRHARGQPVSPAYEGWFQGVDGSVYVSFGYVNTNTEEVGYAAIGPNNKIEPGPADQGQPTRFLPGRQFGVFTVQVPGDRPKTEFTWTLTIGGRTAAIPANLDPLFLINPLKEVGGAHPGNLPPTLRFEADGAVMQGPSGRTLTRKARAGTPLTLEVSLVDDGLPPPAPPPKAPAAPGTTPAAARGGVPPAGTLNTILPRGLSVTWSQYRGTGTVTFASATPAIAQGKAVTTASFSEPGEYMLRALASDGSAFTGQCCWTNGYLRVQVER